MCFSTFFHKMKQFIPKMYKKRKIMLRFLKLKGNSVPQNNENKENKEHKGNKRNKEN